MGLSTTYTKVETDFLLQKLESELASGLKGKLAISDIAPTTQGLYILSDVGTYTNLGGLVTTAGKINYAYFDGTTWSKVEVALSNAKIATWTAQAYPSGSQVIYNGSMYEANDAVLATDIPVESNKWLILNQSESIVYKKYGKFNLIKAIKDFSISNSVNGFVYSLYIGNPIPAGAQQLTLLAYNENDLINYTSFSHFKYSDSQVDAGLKTYETLLSSGESAKISINWDEFGNNILPALPSDYIFKSEVFVGGLLAGKFIPEKQPINKYWAVCGDSIVNANHGNIYDIDEKDPYLPIDGYPDLSTYKRKNFAYYIAQRNGFKWANYGYGGTTLHHCAPKAFPDYYLYPFVDSRIENLKPGVDWDYISLLFGWNDCFFGQYYQRDLWLTEANGVDLGYPRDNQIGLPGFANQAQKDACDAVTGVVGGIHYTNSNDYFFAKFIGTIDDTVKTTYMGAWNYALSYLMKKYPKSKIMIFVPYVSEYSQFVRDSVIAIANKWGVTYFDFEDLPYWFYRTSAKNAVLLNPNDSNGKWRTEGGNELPSTVEGYNHARMSYDTLHPSNLGYQTISVPIEKKLLG